jgi:hypothetical protein
MQCIRIRHHQTHQHHVDKCERSRDPAHVDSIRQSFRFLPMVVKPSRISSRNLLTWRKSSRHTLCYQLQFLGTDACFKGIHFSCNNTSSARIARTAHIRLSKRSALGSCPDIRHHKTSSFQNNLHQEQYISISFKEALILFKTSA